LALTLAVLTLPPLAVSQAGSAPPPDTARPAPRPTPAARPSPKPAPPPALTGTVRGPEGKPIEGAVVLYRPLAASPREFAASTRTDAEGRFRAELKAAGPVYVRVTAKGLAGRSFEKVQPASPLTVVLDRGQAIEGNVRDGAGQPLADALVTASPASVALVSGWDTGTQSIETKTDAKGHFRLGGIGPDLYTVSANARGFGSARKSNVRPGGTVNLVARPGGWLAGRVSDPKGRPLPGALVRAELEPQFWASSAVVATDAEGRFEVPSLDPGAYTVVARHADFAPGVVGGVAVDVEGRDEVAISLPPGAAVSGRVVDAEGRPLEGRVAGQELAGQTMPRSLTELLRADAGADGRFRIERVPPGSYALGVVANRYSGRRIETDVAAADVDLGDIALEEGLTVRGRVRTAAGAPIPDAEITTGGFDILKPSAYVQTRSEADGSYALAGLVPGPMRVNVRAFGFAPINAKTVTPGPDPVDFILTAGGSVSGLVVEDGDRPIDAYRVVASAGKARGPWEGRSEKSVGSADGRFVLEDLTEDTYVLQVVVPDRAPATVAGVRVVPGKTTDAGVIRVPRGGIVRGTVVDSSGDPVNGAMVKAFGVTQDAMEWRDELQALSEPSGSFEIRGVPEGPRQLVASHPDYATGDVMVDVAAAKGPVESRIVLTQGGRIEGVARKRDGTPLAGLMLNVYSASRMRTGGMRPNTVTRADGGFTIEHVLPGPTYVNLMANMGGGRMVSMLSKQVEIREGETASLDLTSRDILMNGHVTKSGMPLAGVRVRFHGDGGMSMMMTSGFDAVQGAPTGPQRDVGTTGEDGTFALILSGPGKYWANTESVDGRTNYPSRELQIPDVETHAVEITFSGVPVTGVVVDKETEQPVAQASVRAVGKDASGPRATTAQTGADGRFQIDAEPGDYTLSAGAEGYAATRMLLTVTSAGVSDARLELEKGLELRGRVLDATGRGIGSIQIQAVGDPGYSGYAETLPDGSFLMKGLSAKRYNLCAGTELAGYAVRMGVSPRGDDVILTLRPAAKVRLLVKGRDGAPLPKVWPTVTKLSGAPISVPWGGPRAPTDSAGVAEVATPAGSLEIEASDNNYSGMLKVSVAEGATANAEVTLTEPVPKAN
jgi:protocatechuate 3,4-dioxygenase beta subunit